MAINWFMVSLNLMFFFLSIEISKCNRLNFIHQSHLNLNDRALISGIRFI